MILTCKYSYDLNPNEPVYAKNVNTVNTYTSVIIQALGGGVANPYTSLEVSSCEPRQPFL